ncbi:Killing trait domain-containing protein [Nannocystis exedens]|uniref:Killing trait domain-containing protein n=1 Tax=Nannocystis exedens TaxID=54 RepID=A0A1I2D5J0_9BACT|nr:RebB family R body protein [Nannocystis exedens]PCC70720.1 Killing trait [Nannocystis exedens]SFE75782.1 Killing trait domain-containing protein [Nannocystis exedens]
MASEAAVNAQITDAVPTAVNSQINDAATETVNSQITDAVTQSNVKVIGDAPAVAMASLYRTMAHSTGLMVQNAVTDQQQLNMAAQAATVQGVALLYGVDTTADGVAAGKVKK